MRLFFALVLGVSFVCAQSATDQKKIRIEGQVQSIAGTPIRKASMRLQGSGGQNGQAPVTYTESTDGDGKFLFDDVAPGRYTLNAEKPGFVAGRYGARTTNAPGTTLNLASGQEMKDVVVVLTPQGVIAGRVTDQDGDPIRGVMVMAVRGTFSRGRRQFVPQGGSSPTDDLGNFRLANLAPGRYYLSATDPSAGFGTGANERPGRTGEAVETNVPTFYPDAFDAAGASPVDVSAGAQLMGYDIRVRKTHVFSLRGKVVDLETKAAPQNVLLNVTPKPTAASIPLPIARAVQQPRPPDGAFELRNMTPGTYVLQSLPNANMNGNPVQPLTGRLEFTITNSNIEGVVLALTAGGEVTGTMRLEDGDIKSLLSGAGTSAAAGRVAVAPAGAFIPNGLRTSIGLVDADTNGFSPNGQAKEDGTFKLSAVAAARYFLNINGLPGGTYIKSVHFGNQDVTHELLDLTSGGSGTLDILLSSKGGDVSGTLRDDKGEAMSGVQVTVWPKTPDRSSLTGGVRTASTDQSGSFKIMNMPPGDYYAAAWDDPEPGLTQIPEFLARFTSESSPVKLAESAHESVTVKLIPRDKIAAEAAKIQ